MGSPSTTPHAGAHAPINPEDFDYDLPKDLVAKHPPASREDARLMRVSAAGTGHRRIAELPELLEAGDLLVLNNTKVRKARLRARKKGGGKVEVVIERIAKDGRTAHAMLGGAKVRKNSVISAGEAAFRVVGRNGRLCELEALGGGGFEQLLERTGEVPLPPYLGRKPQPEDAERYQTVYARTPGACAAPTAGLHFTPALIGRLGDRGIAVATLTLHIGFGTFLPLEAGAEELHPELFEIPQATLEAIARAREAGRRVVACGTSTLRALESGEDAGETRLFIRPGFEFRRVTTLLTNFHLPRSSLFVLVCAFAGERRIREAYREAVAQRYRFLSYGDAMLADGQ